MKNHKNVCDFYEFWSWQYAMRNRDVRTSLKAIAVLSEEIGPPDFSAIFDRYAGHTKLTDKETKALKEMRKHELVIAKTGFSEQSLTSTPYNSTDILLDVANKSDIYQRTPQEKRNFGEYTYVHEHEDCEIYDIDIADYGFCCNTAIVRTYIVDINAPDNEICFQLMRSVAESRCQEINPRRIKCEECKMQNECIIGNGKIDAIDLSITSQRYKNFSGVAFSPEKPEPRAIGLWLWDYVQDHGGESKRGIIAEAIRTLKDKFKSSLSNLGYEKSEERVFRLLHRRTAECIEACQVLSFK